VRAGLLVVLDHVLRAKEPVPSEAEGLPFIPQVLVEPLRRVRHAERGARIVFRLSTTRTLCVTYTVVAAAAGSSLIWNQG
jgi:hypothetical protein